MRRRPSEIRIHVRSIQLEGTEANHSAGARSGFAEGIREAIKSQFAGGRGHSHRVGDRIGRAVKTRLDEIRWEWSLDDSKGAPADPIPGRFPKGG